MDCRFRLTPVQLECQAFGKLTGYFSIDYE
jgi:hypothetical protein